VDISKMQLDLPDNVLERLDLVVAQCTANSTCLAQGRLSAFCSQ